MEIKDGRGTGNKAKVTAEGFLEVIANTRTLGAEVSQHDGEMFAWSILDDTSGAEYVLAIRNESDTKNLVIEAFRVCNDVASVWTVAFGTWSTVGGGVEVTPENMNATSGKEADATAYMTATNLAIKGEAVAFSYAPAGAERIFRSEGRLVLGLNDVIYVHNSAASTGFLTANIKGYYLGPEE